MKPTPEAGLRWLRQAEHDLKIAQSHQKNKDYSDACFMAEQASQKALKSFLIARGAPNYQLSRSRLGPDCCHKSYPRNFLRLLRPDRKTKRQEQTSESGTQDVSLH